MANFIHFYWRRRVRSENRANRCENYMENLFFYRIIKINFDIEREKEREKSKSDPKKGETIDVTFVTIIGSSRGSEQHGQFTNMKN